MLRPRSRNRTRGKKSRSRKQRQAKVNSRTSCNPLELEFQIGEPYTIRMIDDQQVWRKALNVVMDPQFAAHLYISVDHTNKNGGICEYTLGLVYRKDKNANMLAYMGTDMVFPDKIVSVCSKRARECAQSNNTNCNACQQLEDKTYLNREGHMTVRGKVVNSGNLNATQADILNWMVARTPDGHPIRAQAVVPNAKQASKGISTYYHVNLPFKYSLTPNICTRTSGSTLNGFQNCQKLATLFDSDPVPLYEALMESS
jgi:hypothetical protein